MSLIKLAIQTLYKSNIPDHQMIDSREETINKNKNLKIKQLGQPQIAQQTPSPLTQSMWINS